MLYHIKLFERRTSKDDVDQCTGLHEKPMLEQINLLGRDSATPFAHFVCALCVASPSKARKAIRAFLPSGRFLRFESLSQGAKRCSRFFF